MKCLYAGCKTTEEGPDNTFHKVVGSCGRDGNPLYICSEHFEKLKSSKSPSLVSCKQPVIKSAVAAKKGNNQEEKANYEERESDKLQPKEINEDVNEGNPKGNEDVTDKKDDYIEPKFITGPAHSTCQSASLRKKRELERYSEGERERNKSDQGENKDNFEGKSKSVLELNTVRVGPAPVPCRNASFPSILRRKRELREDKKEEEKEPKRYNKGENKGNFEGKKVVEADKKSIVEPKTVRVGPVHRPCPSVSLSSVHRRKREQKEDEEGDNEPKEYNQRATVVVEEETKSVQELRTVRALLGHTRRFLPSIIRRRKELREDKLLEENALKNYHQRETEVWEDNQGQNEAKRRSQVGVEVKKIYQGIHETNKQNNKENEVKEFIQEEYEGDKHNQEEMCKTTVYPSWLLDEFICLEVQHGAVSEVPCQPLPTLPPPRQQPLESNKQSQEETDKTDPHPLPYLDKFRSELQCGGVVTATASGTLPAVPSLYQPPLKANKQDETCQTNSNFSSHSDKFTCTHVIDRDEHGSVGATATACHTLPPPHQPLLEANKHNKEDKKDKHSLDDNEAKNSVERNEANKYYLVVKKHRLEGNAAKQVYLVKKNSLEGNSANQRYLKVIKPSLKGNAANEHSIEENKHSPEVKNRLEEGNSANKNSPEVKNHSEEGSAANKHSLKGNAANEHSLEGRAEHEHSLEENGGNKYCLDGNSANEHNLAVKHQRGEGNGANKYSLEGNSANKHSPEVKNHSEEGSAANKHSPEVSHHRKEENSASKHSPGVKTHSEEGNAANKHSLEGNSANKHSLERNAENEHSLEGNGGNKHCLYGDLANEHNLEVEKHSVEEIAANEHNFEVEKHSMEGNAANKLNLELKKHSLEENEQNKNSLDEYVVKKQRNLKLYENKTKKYSQCDNEGNELDLEEYEVFLSLDENEPKLSLEEYGMFHGLEGNEPNELILDGYKVQEPSLEENEAVKNNQEETAGNPNVEETDENHLRIIRKVGYRSCSAVGCTVSYPDAKLFRFPSDPKRLEIWCRLAYGEYIDQKVGYLCARHFQVKDFYTPERLKLTRGAIPSYPTGPLNPITQDYCSFEDSGGLKEAVYCSAINCGLSQKTHPCVAFTPFPPKSDPRYKEWWKVAGEVRNPKYLCVRHFDVTQFSDDHRTYLKPWAIPKYKSGLFNPQTNDYAPIQQDDSEDSADSSTAVVSAVSPVIGQNIKIAAVSPAVGQNIKIAAVSPAGQNIQYSAVTSAVGQNIQYSAISSDVGQNIRISAASPLVDQKIRITGARPPAGQNLKIASVSSLAGQNIKIAGAGDVLPTNIAVTASNSGAGLIIKIPPGTSFAANPGQSSPSKMNDPPDDVDEHEMDAIYKRCDAVDCPSSYKNDPKIKYFTFPAKAQNCSAAEKKRRQHWIDVVGGTKDGRARFLCQYHFAADTFLEKTRTTLVRKANPLFPYGPLNPVTKDYCPIGEEQRSLSSRDFLRARCCVNGCTTYSFNTSGLFGFPMHDREAYEEWTKRVGVHKYFTEQHIRMKFRICPKHFSSCCTIVDKDKNSVQLKFGALPSINVPCFKGPPNEINSFVQNRTLSTEEIEALKMLSESDRVCDLNDICDKENDEQTSLELKRKISDAKAVPNKKSKDDSATANPGKQLILLPIQDQNGRQTYVVADFGSNENFASISGQNQNVDPQVFNTFDPSTGVQEPTAEKVMEQTKLSKLLKTPVCTYWSPDDFSDKGAVTRKREVAHKERVAQLSKNKVSSSVAPSCKNKNIRVSSKDKSAKEMYEDFSLGIQENNVGNEVDIDTEEVNNVKPPVLPTEKTDNTETALLKIFGSCEASDDNVFSCFVDSSKVPDHEEETSVHSYCSSNSVNVIRSAAELCEFNDLKIKQLERIIGIREDTSSELEQILIKHLSSVMCITGVDFLKKCFDQVLKEAVVKKKEKDKARRYAHKSEPPVPLSEKYPEDTRKLAVALQTFSGKAYHAMTQLIDLPSQSTTRDWTCHKNGDPGFSDRAFKVLQEEAHKKGVVTVSLGVEEVPLKQDVSWDGKRTFGFTDLGYGAVDNDFIPEATRAVVFFATALNRTWKIPLGYCLADNLTASVRANLVIQYLYKLADSGVKCIALVCNYSLVTYQMLVELGAISEEYYAPLTGSFPHPLTKGDRVHCFVDIHQLMKSINTLWAEKKVFSFKNKEEIEWSHMNRMNEFIQSDNKFPNPGFENVYNDLLSLKCLIKRDPRSSYKYNALVLDLLKNLGLDGFENVTGTAVFLDKLHSMTELFSSCHPHDHGERQPLSKGNLIEVTQKLNSVIAYFNHLTYSDGTKVMTSQRKLPLVLLFSNITSLKTMIKKVFTVDKYKLVNIKTESLNLDCLHQTLLQMTDGKEGLLTPLEFKKAFFRFVETINLEPSSLIRVRQKAQESTPLPVESTLGFSNAFSYQFAPVSTVCESVHEFFTENVIENWLQVTHCTDCSQLIQKEMLKYGNHDSKGNVIEDIHRMLRKAETILAELDEIPMDVFTLWFDKLANKTLNSLTSLKGFKNNSHLFNSKPFGEVTHFTVMVKDMLRIFLRLRLCFLSRQEKIRIKPPRQYSLRFCLGRSWA